MCREYMVHEHMTSAYDDNEPYNNHIVQYTLDVIRRADCA